MKQPELYSLQALRALAAVSIVAAHVNRKAQLHLNYNLNFAPPVFADWGIDLFFVLSGFIIFYVHYHDLRKSLQVKDYLLKRFFRIYPIYWIVTLLVIPIFFIMDNIGSGTERNPEVIVKSLLLFPQLHSPILFVGWTIVHEVRFYLIFGLFLFLTRNLRILLSCILLIFTLLIFLLNPPGLNFFIKDYLFSPFNIEFFLGCFSAYIVCLTNSKLQKIYLITAITTFLIYLGLNNSNIANEQILLLSYNNPLIIRDRVFLLGIPFAIVVILLGIYELKYSLRIPPILIYLGDASYSIYLTHFLFISAFFQLLLFFGLSVSTYLPIIMFAVLLLSVCGGYLFYSMLEKPLLNYLRNRFIVRSHT